MRKKQESCRHRLTHEVKPKDKVLYYQDVLLDFGGVFERRPEPLKDVAERLVERAGLDFVKWDMCAYKALGIRITRSNLSAVSRAKMHESYFGGNKART